VALGRFSFLIAIFTMSGLTINDRQYINKAKKWDAQHPQEFATLLKINNLQ
jgi:hypothetical protein